MGMKKIIFVFSLILSLVTKAQNHEEPKMKLYNPSANAAEDIKAAIAKADKEGKHVLLQIGGNWCVWCIRFNDKVMNNDTLKKALEESFVTYHLNYSQENENFDILASLGYPQRFGFPVFVVLDGKGNRLHTQNSAYLEEGKGHGTKKILEFFRHWSPKALDPNKYEHLPPKK